ncbi:fatty acyl-CoA hydrolase precursor, medium chain-like [Lingula anatina]|uniref:Carboxylic ester hydrolase n=1 Tax=Lingula anatina TaxID=7574 RepID=A0A1S3JYW8_LINAN|nr:fatty acyl-CoA hydrolase precursor, medium chain-like [Lingula anatina]|eukprot:XP_013415492.2 fatty acyl-CoA hydrolase precursor, medium chain-like [Lingula anatina]
MSSALYLLVCFCFIYVDSKQFIVQTSNGKLRGFAAETVLGRVIQFLGVPYAKPPVGPLRWQLPEPPDNWNGVRSAKDFGPSCPQKFTTQLTHIYPKEFVRARIQNQKISEDCLFLNIYVPKTVEVNRYDPLPVFVFKHGGKYEWGSGTEFNGTFLALQGNIIVISFNYRLNIFGFLSNGEAELGGNYGMFDTVRVLEWIQTNIRAFGGDPSRVTLGGESAGGVTVDIFLSVSPIMRNRRLFRRGIASAGPHLLRGHKILKGLTVQNTMNIASLLNCSFPTGQQMVSCLRQKTTRELMSAFYQYKGESVFSGNVLVPYGDDIIIDKEVTEYPGRYAYGLDYMLGTCRRDSGFWFGVAGNGSEPNIAIAKGFTQGLVEFLYPGVPDYMTDVAVFEYTSPDMESSHESWLELWQDLFFLAPAWEHALLWPDNSSVYFYEFVHKPSFSIYPHYVNGASHQEELHFFFGDVLDSSLFPTKPTEEEVELSKQVMTAIGNFVRSGNPNPPNPSMSSGTPHWPRIDDVRRQYLEWTVEMTSANVKQDMKPRKMEFWNVLFPKSL